MTLRSFHDALGWVIIGANALVGAWALAAQWLLWLRRRPIWWCIGVAQALLFVQAVVGVALYNEVGGEGPRLHMFYGFLTIVAVAVLYGYRTTLGDRRWTLYGLGSLFIAGLSLQAMANAT